MPESLSPCRNWEGLSEVFHSLASSFAEISNKWENRLIFNEIVLPEDYFSGRVQIALNVIVSMPFDRDGVSDAITDNNVAKSHPPSEKFPGSHLSDSENEQVVLLPIGEPINNEDGSVSVVTKVCMAADHICNELSRRRKRLTYRSLQSGVFSTFPVIADWQSRLVFTEWVNGAIQTCPAVVQCAPKVSNDVSDAERDFDGSHLKPDKIVAGAFTCALSFYEGNLSVSLLEPFVDRFEIVDVLVGPFNLE